MAAIGIIWVIIEYVTVQLYLERKTNSKIQEGDTLEIEAVIKNRSILAIFNLVLKDYLPCARPQEKEKLILLEYLWPKKSLHLKYHCQCPQRDKYALGPFCIYFFDPFGFFFLKKTYGVYSELYVYPKTFNIKIFPQLIKGAAPWFGIETSRVSGDEHEFYGVREYKPGDPIKRIHWLSTARKNRLIVRQFQRQSFLRATIVFNLERDKNFGEGNECVAEYIVRICASIAKYLIESNVSLEVIAHIGEAVNIPFNKGPEHLEDIFQFLAIAKAESRVSLSEIFQEFSKYIPDNSSLIIIMLDTDWDCLSAALSLGRKNISFTPLILDSSSFLSSAIAQKVMKDKRQEFSGPFEFKPIYFSRGDNLEDAFLKF